jgi:hypothetical protein
MEQTAIFVKTFKTIRADGHAVRTIYVLMENGLVQIERRIVSTELNIGFIEIRKFGKFIKRSVKPIHRFYVDGM